MSNKTSRLGCCCGRDRSFPFSWPKNTKDLNSIMEMAEFVGIRGADNFFSSTVFKTLDMSPWPQLTKSGYFSFQIGIVEGSWITLYIVHFKLSVKTITYDFIKFLLVNLYIVI